jgi:hypothetical protein
VSLRSPVGLNPPIGFTSLLTCVFLSSASFVGLLIYASIIFHRSRKGTLNRRSAAVGAGMEPYSQPTAYPSYTNQPKPSYEPGDNPGSYNMNDYRQA